MIGALVPITILYNKFSQKENITMEIRLFDLDNRLSLCAEFVRKNSKVADIGTDHAYLPVWLCKNNIAVNAIAADINPMPLERGIKTIEKYSAKDVVTPRLSDGLKEIKPDEADDIIIAGMGGEIITSIIDNAQWLKNSKYHLILQPMTKAEVLREYLYTNGFTIENEKATVAENKLYTVLSVYYIGKAVEEVGLKKYYGKVNPKNSEHDKAYIEKVAKALLKKGNGILSANPYSNTAKKYIAYSNKLLVYATTGDEPQMTTVNDIYKYIDSFAPFDTALDFDNVGILAGDRTAVVNKVLVALDITEDVIVEAQNMGATLIISHHPIIFKPLKSLNSNSIPYMLAQRGMTAISAHTNLDLSAEGVNICLAKALGLENIYLHSEGIAVGDIKTEKPFTSKQFAEYTKQSLNCNGVRYTDIKNKITRVAVGGGACGEYIYLAKELGADAFVTGEIKHNYILESHSLNLTIVDAGHYKTEDVVINFLTEKLANQFPNVEFTKSKTFTDYINYV